MRQFAGMSRVKTDNETIRELLERATVEIIPRAEVEKKLRSGKTLRIKVGIDPSGPDLHLGHAVQLRKLKKFQEAGHQVVIIIGDWTARIGDPTGKNEMRTQLTPAQVKKNAEKYLKQIFLILDKKKTEVARQSKWFNKFTLQDVFSLLGKFTVSQLLNRDDFRERQKTAVEIGYHEPIYSVLQGYDSVMVKADIELGATEQLFNLLKGRDLQRIYNQPEQGVITTEILIGLDGQRKMGKSLSNYIAMLDAPEEMYGKVMSIPDTLILHYFELTTDVPEQELKEIEKALIAKSVNPRDLKMRLAKEVVTLYHSAKDAQKAEEYFVSLFQKKELPSDIEEVKLKEWPNTADALIVAAGLAKSASEARRLIEERGIKIDGQPVLNPKERIVATQAGVLMSRGKRMFKRVFKK